MALIVFQWRAFLFRSIWGIVAERQRGSSKWRSVSPHTVMRALFDLGRCLVRSLFDSFFSFWFDKIKRLAAALQHNWPPNSHQSTTHRTHAWEFIKRFRLLASCLSFVSTE
jgi:hypothetical protein